MKNIEIGECNVFDHFLKLSLYMRIIQVTMVLRCFQFLQLILSTPIIPLIRQFSFFHSVEHVRKYSLNPFRLFGFKATAYFIKINYKKNYFSSIACAIIPSVQCLLLFIAFNRNEIIYLYKKTISLTIILLSCMIFC